MTRVSWLHSGAAMALLVVAGCNPSFDQVFSLGDTQVSLALLPADRFQLVRAVDILVFSGDQYDCPTLLKSRLDDPVLREKAFSIGSKGESNSEHVRLCDSRLNGIDAGEGASGATLGRIQEGKKVVLVTASYLSERCLPGANNAAQGPEVALPGHVLAAGCQPATVAGGKVQPVTVVLVPFRDPVP
jgi:hypothetical protein